MNQTDTTTEPSIVEPSIGEPSIVEPSTTDWTPVHVTRSLLGWGVIAEPCYVITSVAQGLLREGFDFSRHQWSLLANGDHGWLQVTNFVLTGLMLVAFAVGLGRALDGGVAGRRGSQSSSGSAWWPPASSAPTQPWASPPGLRRGSPR